MRSDGRQISLPELSVYSANAIIKDAQITSDSGAIVTGFYYSRGNPATYFVERLSKCGKSLWSQIFDLISDKHIPSGVIENRNGNFIIAGTITVNNDNGEEHTIFWVQERNS